MKRNLFWGVLALAALCGELAMSPAHATRLAQPGSAPAQPFALVKDINTTSQPRSSVSSSTLFGTVNNRMLFSANTPQTGSELWRTDGTAAGTQLVKDIFPGENGTFNSQNIQSLVLNNQLLFAPNDGAHGTELWASDGTPGGTRLLKDLFPGADSSDPINFVASGNRAFFSAQISATQQALWITDGTPGGTFMLHAFAKLENAPVLAGNTLFFSAGENDTDIELWQSDGTPAGTVLVKDIAAGPAGSFPGNLFAFSASEVWFSANDGVHGNELWRSDGTLDGTHRFNQPAVGLVAANPSQFIALHRASQIGDFDTILFNAQDGTHGQELWASSGSPANTAPLKDVNPTGSSNPTFLGLRVRQDGVELAFYKLDDGTHGGEIWVTDGTPAGTIMLADIYTGINSSDPSKVITIGNVSFFAATSPTVGRVLWKTDGTPAGTVQVPASSDGTQGSLPEDMTTFNGKLYFSAEDSVHGRELWKTDGTTTTLVKDIQPGDGFGMSGIIGVALGRLYVAANDGTTGIELWKSDGTEAGTVQVQNIAPDTGGIFFNQGDVGALGEKLLFGIDLASNGESLVANPTAALWQSDGTDAGTSVVKPFPNASRGAPLAELTTLGDGMLFTRNDGDDVTELWRTDGTAAGTGILTNIVKPHFGFVYNLNRLNNLVVFDVYTSTLASEPLDFTSLWRTDGTPAGTQMIAKDVTTSSYDHAVSGNTLFFANSPKDHSSNVELWKTDGSAGGTRQVSEIAAGDTGSYPHDITPGQPGEVFFIAQTESSGYQLWKSDGTAAGTVFIHNMGLSDGEQQFGKLAYADGTLFFPANDGVNGWELWKSDGTDAGTVIVADSYPGAGSSQPDDLIDLNGVLHFTATGPDGRRTLWKSDGTPGGTLPIRNDADAPLNPTELTVVQGHLFFSAADTTHGREPWRSDGTAAGTMLMQDIVPGAGSSNPWPFIGAGQQLYFTADTPESGRELWALASSQSPGQPTPTPLPDQPTPTPLPGQSPDQRVNLPLLLR